MKVPDKKYPLSVVGDLLASTPSNEVVFMPDKIYVHKGVHLGMLTLTAIPVDAPGEETYIRKDALIEWLEGRMTKEGATEGFVGGYDIALKDVVDKINSM